MPSNIPWCLGALLLSLALSACESVPDRPPTLAELSDGDAVKASGRWLMSVPMGMARLDSPPTSHTTAIVAVHGFKSEGYEWVYPIKKLSEGGQRAFFYRWDWTQCPEPAAEALSGSIKEILNKNKNLDKIVVFGHSYGGVIAAALTRHYKGKTPLELHLIASPLAGHPKLQAACDWPGVVPPPKGAPIAVHEWRTVQALDGAFKKLASDPQVIELEGSAVKRLPREYRGRRLGHNWSISWVADRVAKTSGDTP